MTKSPVAKITGDLDGALNSLISGKGTFVDGGEAVVTIMIGKGSRANRHLTKSVCQTLKMGRLSDSAMGRTGLIKMSDLWSHEVWDRIGLERAYTAMNGNSFNFSLSLRDASSRDTTAGSQDWGNLGNLTFTGLEARSSWRQRRACSGWRRNGERIMLTSKIISQNSGQFLRVISLTIRCHTRCQSRHLHERE